MSSLHPGLNFLVVASVIIALRGEGLFASTSPSPKQVEIQVTRVRSVIVSFLYLNTTGELSSQENA